MKKNKPEEKSEKKSPPVEIPPTDVSGLPMPPRSESNQEIVEEPPKPTFARQRKIKPGTFRIIEKGIGCQEGCDCGLQGEENYPGEKRIDGSLKKKDLKFQG